MIYGLVQYHTRHEFRKFRKWEGFRRFRVVPGGSQEGPRGGTGWKLGEEGEKETRSWSACSRRLSAGAEANK